jgi:hypothetical protein
MQVVGHLRIFCPFSTEGKPLTLVIHGQTVDRGVGRMYVAPVVGPCYICCSGAVLIVALQNDKILRSGPLALKHGK